MKKNYIKNIKIGQINHRNAKSLEYKKLKISNFEKFRIFKTKIPEDRYRFLFEKWNKFIKVRKFVKFETNSNRLRYLNFRHPLPFIFCTFNYNKILKV